MCDEFICSDSGVGLCEDDRKLLESLGSRKSKSDVQKNDEKCSENVEKGGNKIEDKEADNNNDVEEIDRNITEHENKNENSGTDIIIMIYHN